MKSATWATGSGAAGTNRRPICKQAAESIRRSDRTVHSRRLDDREHRHHGGSRECCQQVSLRVTELVADGTHGRTRTSLPPPPIKRRSARGASSARHWKISAASTGGVVVQAAHQDRAAGTATGRRAAAPLKANPLRRQPIQVGSLGHRVAVATQLHPQIVGDNHNHVAERCRECDRGGCGGGEKGQH